MICNFIFFILLVAFLISWFFSFDVQGFLSLMKFHVTTFYFVTCAFQCYVQEIIAKS